MANKLSVALNYATTLMGVPYIWGGNHPKEGYDCSGFVQEVLAAVGLDPSGDQTAQTLYDHFNDNGAVTLLKPDKGAILFFGMDLKHITHIAIALDDEHMFEAGGGGSKTITLKDAVRASAFVRCRPIKNRKDLVASLLPKY